MNQELQDAILNGLYDKNYLAHENFTPSLLNNNHGQNIWFSLRHELLTCTNFTWAVAFITQDMLVPFKVVMADLATKNVHGTIITGTYQNFNDPKVFEELKKIPNLAVKIANNKAFHAKGYLFDHESYQTLIIGSANFTRSALLANYEWALKVTTSTNATLIDQIHEEFTQLKHASFDITNDWIDNYKFSWHPIKQTKVSMDNKKIIPNMMQQDALRQLDYLVKNMQNKAIIVSATGTGKTYLGAFAVKDFAPKRFLYIVHRQQIAKKSMVSFKKVIGGINNKYGLLTGNRHDVNAKYLFATVQTLSQATMLKQFTPTDFDYIIIDEAHRSAAPSYQKILNYFKPKFWLGMTATPERMDEQDVYKIFDYNLAYEIRLDDALKANMLAPFHYVGVQDYEQNGEIIDELSDLKQLASSERVNYILKEIDYYGYCGKQAKGLVFCSRQQEAHELADIFTKRGYPSIALTNSDSQKRRDEGIKALEQGKINYILTVDLFNEGVDIPSLNQIIMLRNTESSIVFIQQLGRGLRKYPGKDFAVVIDFIGNYKNNYLIPIALNGDKSRNKDRVKQETLLPNLIGISTINFSQIASRRILNSLNQVKLDSLLELRKSYHELKQKIGRVPLLYDFYQYGSTDPMVFAQNHNLTSYASFLKKMNEKVTLSTYEAEVLSFLTKELLNGKRLHELLLLQELIDAENITLDKYEQVLKVHGAYIDSAVLQSVMDVLSLRFFDVKAGKTTRKVQYGNLPIVVQQNLVDYALDPTIKNALSENMQFKDLVLDVIKTGLEIAKQYQSNRQFTLYKQYNRKDVCRLLNWPLDVSAPMYGYRVSNNECPIFITYQKQDDQKRNSIYKNTLENGASLRWYTRSPRHMDSQEVQTLTAGVENNQQKTKLYLFVKRDDSYGKEFFYLGNAKIKAGTVKEETLGQKKNKAAIGMDLVLTHPLSSQMYEILFGNE